MRPSKRASSPRKTTLHLIARASSYVAVPLLLASACGSAPTPISPNPIASSAPIQASSLPEPAEPVASASAAPSAKPPEESEPPRTETIPELAHFYAALRGLEHKTRKTHVRVFWMGDSHAQADFWSGALRDALQARFGNAGPGFLHLGYKNYRHDGVKLETEGRWRMRPKKPAGVKTDGDGVVGLGGLLMGGYEEQPRADVTVTESLPGKTIDYDFCYRLKKSDETIDVTVGGKRPTLTATKSEPAGAIRHATFTSDQPGDFAARPTNGTPDFCGVTIETDPSEAPGVVLDTLGINGARYATAVSWNEKSWQSEVARRAPDLVVLEYGTNEAGDPTPANTATGKHMGELLKRIRAVKADVDCVVVSATDRMDAVDRVEAMNTSLQAAAKTAGCFYFDAYTILGGKGAAEKLRDETPPRVQKDGIHMTIRGYREIGKTMFDAIMKGY